MLASLAIGVFLTPVLVLAALEADLDSSDSIKKAARLVAEDLMQFYHGHEPGNTVGILPGPPPAGDYYWWQGGAMWGLMLDYWHTTGDDTWNDYIYDSLLHQAAPNRDFMHTNWSASLGNDDQAFWGMTAMIAAEEKFRDPPEDEPQWLALTQAVWNEQAAPDRRDDTCGGGLRWQIFVANVGYNYKNTISNGCFFNMGARLARYTNNETYAKWSSDTWDWLVELEYIDKDYNVYDGAHVPENCKDIDKQQYSYNPAVLLLGAAHMYNFTEDPVWEERVNKLVDQIIVVFFPDGIAIETACENTACSYDAITFKGYLHRWMASASQVAPFLREKIRPVLKSSAQAAVNQCTGGDSGRMCGLHWASGAFDGLITAGTQMSALGALVSLLLISDDAAPPVTNLTGGTSGGDPDAGVEVFAVQFDPIRRRDKAGAGILTIMLLTGGFATIGWMLWD